MFTEALGYIYLFLGGPLGSTIQFLGQAAQGGPQPHRAVKMLHVTRPVPKTCPFKTHTSIASPPWPDLTSALLALSPPSLNSHVSLTIAAPTVVLMGKSCALSCKLLTADRAVPTATASPQQRVDLMVGGEQALHYSTDLAKSATRTFLRDDLLTWWPHKYLVPQ